MEVDLNFQLSLELFWNFYREKYFLNFKVKQWHGSIIDLPQNFPSGPLTPKFLHISAHNSSLLVNFSSLMTPSCSEHEHQSPR